ncbi:MAG TPA: hypothetical protein VK210_17885, partial [Terriglobia bacterium]|nr:hypothetical protein [Terriglobia bacterium]
MNRKLVLVAILALVATAYAQIGSVFGQGGRRPGGGGGGYAGNCIVPGAQFGNGEGDTSLPRNINRANFVYARVRYHLQPNWR